MMPVRQDVLVHVRDFERLRQVRWVARLDRLYQMPEGAIESVHRCGVVLSSTRRSGTRCILRRPRSPVLRCSDLADSERVERTDRHIVSASPPVAEPLPVSDGQTEQ